MHAIILNYDASTKIKHSNINISLSADTSAKRYHGSFSIDAFSTNVDIIVLAIRVNKVLPGGTLLAWGQTYYDKSTRAGGYIRIESIQAYVSNNEAINVACTIAYIDL